MMHIVKRTLIAAALVSTVGLTDTQTAEACTYAPAEWYVQHSGNTLLASADGPLVIQVTGWDNPYDSLPDLSVDTFDVVLVDADAAQISGALEVRPGVAENDALLLFTPDEPLDATGSYTLTITGSEFTGEVVLPLELLEIGQILVAAQLSDLTEHVVGTDQACCDTPPEDYACEQDSCGDYEYGEECRLCWFETNTYPVRSDVTWETPSDVPPAYLEHQVFRVTDAGEELVVSTKMGGHARINWDEGFAEDYCVRIEVRDVIRDTTATTDVVCLTSADVTTVERVERELPDIDGRCEAGTITEPDIDPDSDPDVNPEGDGESDGEKGSPGGCNTSAEASPAGLAAFALLFVGFFGLRRLQR